MCSGWCFTLCEPVLPGSTFSCPLSIRAQYLFLTNFTAVRNSAWLSFLLKDCIFPNLLPSWWNMADRSSFLSRSSSYRADSTVGFCWGQVLFIECEIFLNWLLGGTKYYFETHTKYCSLDRRKSRKMEGWSVSIKYAVYDGRISMFISWISMCFHWFHGCKPGRGKHTAFLAQIPMAFRFELNIHLDRKRMALLLQRVNNSKVLC